MRWYEYLVTLPHEEQERLTNTLTLAAGYVSGAVRVMGRDAATGEVYRSLTAAERLLRSAGGVLDPTVGSEHEVTGLSLPEAAQTLSWRSFLRMLPEQDVTVLLRLLQSATGHGRTALQGAVADAEIEAIRLDLVAAIAALASARHAIRRAIEDRVQDTR